MEGILFKLRADNEWLHQEQATTPCVPSSASASNASIPVSATVSERLVVIPRDRKCPMYNGKTGQGITEWIEEVQACMHARHLSAGDQAFFIFDHLEGETKEEIKYLPSRDQRDPERIFAILKELYGCDQSYVTLQQVGSFLAPLVTLYQG